MKPPFSWGDRMRPSCEPRTLTVGDRFLTGNRGLFYDVTLPSHVNESLEEYDPLASVQYLNNPLQNCGTGYFNIILNKVDDAKPSKTNSMNDSTSDFAGPAWWSWEGHATAHVWCTIPDSKRGTINLELDTKFELIDVSISRSVYHFVLNSNYENHASVWWGSRLMMVYWFGLLTAMAKTVPNKTAT